MFVKRKRKQQVQVPESEKVAKVCWGRRRACCPGADAGVA